MQNNQNLNESDNKSKMIENVKMMGELAQKYNDEKYSKLFSHSSLKMGFLESIQLRLDPISKDYKFWYQTFLLNTNEILGISEEGFPKLKLLTTAEAKEFIQHASTGQNEEYFTLKLELITNESGQIGVKYRGFFFFLEDYLNDCLIDKNDCLIYVIESKKNDTILQKYLLVLNTDFNVKEVIELNEFRLNLKNPTINLKSHISNSKGYIEKCINGDSSFNLKKKEYSVDKLFEKINLNRENISYRLYDKDLKELKIIDTNTNVVLLTILLDKNYKPVKGTKSKKYDIYDLIISDSQKAKSKKKPDKMRGGADIISIGNSVSDKEEEDEEEENKNIVNDSNEDVQKEEKTSKSNTNKTNEANKADKADNISESKSTNVNKVLNGNQDLELLEIRKWGNNDAFIHNEIIFFLNGYLIEQKLTKDDINIYYNSNNEKLLIENNQNNEILNEIVFENDQPKNVKKKPKTLSLLEYINNKRGYKKLQISEKGYQIGLNKNIYRFKSWLKKVDLDRDDIEIKVFYDLEKNKPKYKKMVIYNTNNQEVIKEFALNENGKPQIGLQTKSSFIIKDLMKK